MAEISLRLGPIIKREFTIEVFSRTLYLDGRQAEPDDGIWYELKELGSVQTFNTEDEAIEYLQNKFPWLREQKPYSHDAQIEWRVVRTETERVVVNTNVLRGFYLHSLI